MKRFQLVTLFTFALLGGCVNIYTRCPGTDEKITQVYQCSREAAALAVIGSCPQMMSDAPDRGWRWENCLTIPFIGLPCAVDAVCEGVIDTVCLPVDWPLAEARKENK
jgi:uncharacterized protein YceK